jgi:precorrin-8X/cobalt-precorrin-8 methylmutase
VSSVGRRSIHPIERESYEILRRRVDTSHLPPLTRAVVERVVHASADLDYVEDLVCDEESLVAGRRALASGASLVVDAQMVRAGVTTRDSICLVRDPRTAALALDEGLTRSAAAIRLALEQVGPGAVWVIGNAPTALFELLNLAGQARPALVIGLPVGFVGAAESKQALRDAGLPALSNRSEKGGTAVAAAALNALLYAEDVAPAGPLNHSRPDDSRPDDPKPNDPN